MAAALAAATLLVLAGPAAADTFQVVNTNDSGTGSLREAITASNANNNSVEDTIEITATGTVQLQSALPSLTNDNPSGRDLTIDGPGMDDFTVRRDTGGDYGIFAVNTAAAEVAIDGLTITNGLRAGFGGGGVQNLGDLTLTDVRVDGNQATQSPSSPTGPASGGGIRSDGDLTLTRVELTANTASQTFGGSGASGAGLYSADGVLTITGGEVSDNTATGVAASGGAGITITSGVDAATLTDLVVSRNTATASAGGAEGAGIRSSSGSLTLVRTVVDANTASGDSGGSLVGGGIRHTGGSSTGPLQISDSTVSNNSITNATGDAGGGGIASAQAVATIENTTVSGNAASSTGTGAGFGGGIVLEGTDALRSVTVSDNGAGGGEGDNLFLSSTTPTVENTIVSAPRNNDNCTASVSVTSQGHNLEDGDTCGFNQASDQENADPQLGALADNGGPTKTHAIPQSSPALDQGDNTAGGFAFDQRGSGFARTADFAGVANNPDGGDGTDVGAFELQPGPLFVVDSLADGSDSSAGDGSCDVDAAPVDPGDCTLRAAIEEANANDNSVQDTIDVQVTGTVQLQSALPNLTNDNTSGTDLTIAGPGMDDFIVRRDAGGEYRIFTVSAGAEVSIEGLTATEGEAPASSPSAPFPAGGGIFNNAGDLTLTDVAVSDNQATSTGGAAQVRGGGIYTLGALTLTAVRVDNNRATASGSGQAAFGGGIAEDSQAGGSIDITLDRTVVEANVVSGEGLSGGGGISAFDSLTVTDSTVSANSVSSTSSNANGGGINQGAGSGTATIENSTVSGNTVSESGGGSPIGGGIFALGALTLTSATVADNGSGAAGENLHANITSATFENTIVADPRTGNDNCTGTATFTSQGHNLEDADTCGFDQASDQVSADPLLEPLADNGGPTKTHAFPESSPAVDQGDNTAGGFAFDQRGTGFDRTVDFASASNSGDGTDVGAFELQSLPPDSPPTAVDDGATVAEDSGASAIDVLANDTDPDGGPKSIDSVTQPANGTVAITGGGTGLTYEPDAGYCNEPGAAPTDDFDYTLAPGGSTATVAVTVTCVPPPAQCADSQDNDGDGKVDLGADPGCDSAGDDDETDPPPAGGGAGGGSGGGAGTDDGGSGAGGDSGGGVDVIGDAAKVRPVFKLGIRSARQRGRRVVVRIKGRLLKRQGRPCRGRAVAVVRTGGRRARRVVRLKGRCAFTRRVRFRVAKLKPKFRPRRRVLLVRAGGRYRGSSMLAPDRAPATRKRVKR